MKLKYLKTSIFIDGGVKFEKDSILELEDILAKTLVDTYTGFFEIVPELKVVKDVPTKSTEDNTKKVSVAPKK